MTEEAVADLLDAGGYADAVGWTTRNISTALCLVREPLFPGKAKSGR